MALFTEEGLKEIALKMRRIRIFDRYAQEMERQDELWGSQRHLANTVWATILGEEVGEACKEVLEEDKEKLIMELVQCGAVTTQWLDALIEEDSAV